jgi:hypothetical protein
MGQLIDFSQRPQFFDAPHEDMTMAFISSARG